MNGVVGAQRLLLGKVGSPLDQVVIDVDEVELVDEAIKVPLGRVELFRRDAPESTGLSEGGPGFHARQADADQAVRLVPDRASRR